MPSVPNSGSSAPPPPVWNAPPAGAATIAYGGFWIRFLAYVIDAILLGAVGGIVGLVLPPIDPEHYEEVLFSGQMGASLLIGWLYFALMESSERGATIGKMVLGLRVVTDQGQRLSFANATGRYFAKFVSAVILCIGFIMIGFTERKRGLHDMLAGTLVIKAR